VNRSPQTWYRPILNQSALHSVQTAGRDGAAVGESRQVSVRRVNLLGKEPIALWDFQHTMELIGQGYQITKEEIDNYLYLIFDVSDWSY